MSFKMTSLKYTEKNLPTQNQLDDLEIRFDKCVITYKLKHIETQPSKSRWRKVGKCFGFSFRPLRLTFENGDDQLFRSCIFNPSDLTIVKDHIKNLETPRLSFINCKFLRRDSLLTEKFIRSWRKRRGLIVKFTGRKGVVDIQNDILRLKDLPLALEFVMTRSKEVIL